MKINLVRDLYKSHNLANRPSPMLDSENSLKKYFVIKVKDKIKVLFFVLAFISSNSIYSQFCEINTSTEPRHGLPHPDCDLSLKTEQCVKIKFHFVDNTTEEKVALTDQECAIILDELNKAFKPSKIKFDFAGECVHRTVIEVVDGSSPFEIFEKIADPMTGIPIPPANVNYDPNMEYVPGHLNIYFAYGLGFYIGVLPADAVIIDSPEGKESITNFNSSLCHEIGHVLGLGHTMGQFALGQTEPVHSDCLCKSVTYEHPIEDGPACEWTQDCLCDTGLDPYSMDLDNDDLADGHKWVVNGRQIPALTPSFEDGCEDSTTPWNIPANNIMSYYNTPMSARNHFTPCQGALMHDILDNIQTDIVQSCGSGDLYGICDDIIIDEPTTWLNTTVELCRNQKIIITRDGSLTLNNTTLTRGELPDPPSISCPDLVPELVHYWQGIELDNRLKSEGANVPAQLNVINGSVIEYAKTALSIPYSMGVVEMNGSTIRKCIALINAVDYNAISALLPGPTVFPTGSFGCYLDQDATDPSISLVDCSISTDEISSYVVNSTQQIKLNGVSILLDGTTMTNNEGPIIKGIHSSRGRVKIVNGSSIVDYHTGITKQMDMLNLCSPRGLDVRDSRITCENIAIESTASNNFLKESYFDKTVSIDGLGYSYIFGNNFKDDEAPLDCRNTFKSNIIQENLFYKSWIFLEGSNNGTNVTCNTWQQNSTGVGVDITSGSSLPPSWGDNDVPAGNKHDNNPNPDFTWPGTGAGLVHRVITSQSLQVFDVFDNVSQTNSNGTNSCTYSLWPNTPPSIDPYWSDSTYDLDELDEDYADMTTLLNTYNTNILVMTGTNYVNMTHKIGQLKINRDEVVRKALSSATLADSADIGDWITRLDSKLISLSKYFSMWYHSDFSTLSDTLDLRSNSDADNLKTASDLMARIISSNRSMLEATPLELDTLTEIAGLSFGDYTNILRTFLAAEYDIYVYRPDPLLPRSDEESNKEQFVQVISNRYISIPNPSNGCFRILPNENGIKTFDVEIYNSVGMLTDKIKCLNPETYICLKDAIPGIYFAKIAERESGYSEVLKLILN